MKKIYIFEERSCNPTDSDGLVQSLHRWYRNGADVRSFDLTKPGDLVPLPPKLFLELQEQGSACLPALVSDGKILSRGHLPTFDQAVELIEGQVEAPLQPVSGATSCCPPSSGGACC